MQIDKKVPIKVDKDKMKIELANNLLERMCIGDSVMVDETIMKKMKKWEVAIYSKQEYSPDTAKDGNKRFRCWLLGKQNDQSRDWAEARKMLQDTATRPLEQMPVYIGKNPYVDKYIEYRIKNQI